MRLFLATIHGELAALSINCYAKLGFSSHVSTEGSQQGSGLLYCGTQVVRFFYSSIGAISMRFHGFFTNKKADKTGIAFV
jgi:hypothetical protein